MQFAREIQRLFFGVLIAFGIVGLSATYWAIAGQGTILLRDDNPRTIENIARIQRGHIYDRDDTLLIQTMRDNGNTIRQYLEPSTYSALGYYSLRYGEGGAEFAFNDILTGDTTADSFSEYLEQTVLQVPPVGADIRLTLDLDIQDTLVELMGNQKGAGVVMDAQTGDIMALVSLPTYDPNTLDANWDDLTQAEGDPFFNRALQGQYQLGGVMYTLWMSQALLTRYDTTQLIANANDRVSLSDDTLIGCVFDDTSDTMSLIDGHIYGCPVPFAVYQRTTSERTFDDLVSTFSLDAPLTLTDFPVPEPISPTSGTQAEIDPTLIELGNTLGQGTITTTPLHVAGILSAIVHNGNAHQPNILDSVRQQDTEQWQDVTHTTPSIPMMTSVTARQLRTILRDGWQTIQLQTYPETLSIGATIATSQSGEETQLWLIGFVGNEQGNRVAFVVLLENTKDIQTIITLGQNLIQAIIDETLST